MKANETLGQLADKLNEQIARADYELLVRYRGRFAEVELGDGQRALAWRHDGLVISSTDHEGMRHEMLLSRTTLDTRIAAAQLLPKLFKQLESDITNTGRVADELCAYLDRLTGSPVR